jgi:NitT/TauT family transport system permease protein
MVAPKNPTARRTLSGPPVATRVQRLGGWLGKRLQIVSLLVAGGLWEVIGRLNLFSFVPAPSAVVVRWKGMLTSGAILDALEISVQAFVKGLALSILMATIAALLMTTFKTFDYIFDPYINFFMTTPIIALIPVFIIFFGIGEATRIAVIFAYCFSLMVVNFKAGLQASDPKHVEMVYAFGADKRRMLKMVKIQAAMPLILAGLRIGTGRALRGMVNAEVIIGVTGIGALLINAGKTFDMPALYAVILTIVVWSVVLVAGLNYLERRVLSWQR